ncbi:MAG: DUF4783 domain-containing protein [Ignavibacteriae bacterium]|nr:DUF4783 domain-containing protein [Ignavibacteriota bacterium]
MKIRILLTITVFFIVYANLNAQDDWWKDKKYKDEKTKAKYALCKKTFKDIASGFNTQNVNKINAFFGSEVYLNIISNEKGYYSPNQAELILSDFMDYFRVVSFKYKHSYFKSTFAFALGKYVYDRGSGKRELSASVSLKYKDEKWIIDQISLN